MAKREEKTVKTPTGELKKTGIENQYVGKTPKEVWDAWTPAQRGHFLKDHIALPYVSDKELLIKADWDDLVKLEPVGVMIDEELLEHMEEGEYKAGGPVAIKQYRLVPWQDREGMPGYIEAYYEKMQTVETTLPLVIAKAEQLLKEDPKIKKIVIEKLGKNALKSKIIGMVTSEGFGQYAEGGAVEYSKEPIHGNMGVPFYSKDKKAWFKISPEGVLVYKQDTDNLPLSHYDLIAWQNVVNSSDFPQTSEKEINELENQVKRMYAEGGVIGGNSKNDDIGEYFPLFG